MVLMRRNYYCSGHLTPLPKRLFDPVYAEHGLCRECVDAEVDRFRQAYPSIRYDYRFARSALGYSHIQAVGWIATGYGFSYPTAQYGLQRSASRNYDWSPDPYDPVTVG